MRADGLVISAKRFRPEKVADPTTPSARAKVASRHFLDRPSTLLFKEGNFARF